MEGIGSNKRSVEIKVSLTLPLLSITQPETSFFPRSLSEIGERAALTSDE
jgi:hypothetical protein